MALRDTREPALPTTPKVEFSAAEIGALAHLYRGEVYRSTVWRTRLDSTTNWAVVTTGIALSATFSSAEASPLPMVLVGLIVTVFLLFEARRYRYFNVWRARARLLETDFYAPMIRGEGIRLGAGWAELLAKDYCDPRYHISFARAIGRRLRRTWRNLPARSPNVSVRYTNESPYHPVRFVSRYVLLLRSRTAALTRRTASLSSSGNSACDLSSMSTTVLGRRNCSLPMSLAFFTASTVRNSVS
jgi:hypothetical protein